MSLSLYKKKRNFNETAEPRPVIGKDRGARTFVIQRHNASRLHYDFRLEVNGVLKSWAVPKGPSLNPTDKRLAMMVEDHPLSYGTFKGVIPEGNYGAGIVEIWDSGTYDPEEMEKVSDNAIEKNIKNGMLKFSLKGKKLKGSFALVRIKGADSKNWLLIKHRDKYATEEPYNSEEHTPDNSPINKQLREEGEAPLRPASKTAGKQKAKSTSSSKSSSASKSKLSSESQGNSPARSVSDKQSSLSKSSGSKSPGSKSSTAKSSTATSSKAADADRQKAVGSTPVKKSSTGTVLKKK